MDRFTRLRHVGSSGFWAVLIGGGLLFVGAGAVSARRSHAAYAEYLAQAEARVQKLAADRDALVAERQALKTDPARIEALLRERLHWMRPGEIGLDAVRPPAPQAPHRNGQGAVGPVEADGRTD